MKKILGALLCTASLMACQTTPSTNVSGHLCTDADSLLVFSFPVNNRNLQTRDTVVLKDGRFAINLNDSVVKQVQIYALQGQMINMAENIHFLLVPGKAVEISGNLKEYQLGGDAFYKACQSFHELGRPWDHQLDSMGQHLARLYQSGLSQDSLKTLRNGMQPAIETIIRQKRQAQSRFIEQHRNEDVAIYGLTHLDAETAFPLLDKISKDVQEGILSASYQLEKKSCESFIARKKAEENIQPGKPAPDFTLTDLNGKSFTLSSLKGKFVVLDFWGSWCGWCIKGMPEMKKAYQKHRSHVEFVGIDCNDTEEKWRAAVQKNELPWIQVRNTATPGLPEMYAVGGYPTKIIIDRKGNIVKVMVGEHPAFYSFLDQLVK